MQRAARFLLWGGLALLVLSMASCGAGCVISISSAVEGEEATGGGFLAFGTVSLFASIVMIIIGAVLKAVAPKSRECR